MVVKKWWLRNVTELVAIIVRCTKKEPSFAIASEGSYFLHTSSAGIRLRRIGSWSYIKFCWMPDAIQSFCIVQTQFKIFSLPCNTRFLNQIEEIMVSDFHIGFVIWNSVNIKTCWPVNTAIESKLFTAGCRREIHTRHHVATILVLKMKQ